MVKSSRLQSAVVGTYRIIVEGQTVPYTVKRSFRARHLRLEVRGITGLTVVVPRYYNVRQVSELLRKKGRWILDKLARHGKVHPPHAEKELRSGDTIPFLGQQLKLVKVNSPKMADSVKLEKNRLLVNFSSRNGRLNLILEAWYRHQAERLIKRKASELCRQLGVTYDRLTIRGAKTRWGSCSQKGNLNFNWKLMMVPEPVIDYVVIHELAHLKEMNHSKEFWNLVAEHCPRWREHRRWLKEYEAGLTGRPISLK